MNKINKKVYLELLKEMAKFDQKMRKNSREGKTKWNKKIDKINSNNLKKIISEIGWPSAKKVGAMCEKYAWLVVQHSPDQIFQKNSLLLMKKESYNKKLIAYLEDRVRVSEGKKQLYGTQFYIGTNGELEPRPIYNLKKLSYRRKSVGLGSFNEYYKKIRRSFRKNSLYKKNKK